MAPQVIKLFKKRHSRSHFDIQTRVQKSKIKNLQSPISNLQSSLIIILLTLSLLFYACRDWLRPSLITSVLQTCRPKADKSANCLAAISHLLTKKDAQASLASFIFLRRDWLRPSLITSVLQIESANFFQKLSSFHKKNRSSKNLAISFIQT